MRKLFALYTNEMIKISRKTSIIVLLSIMVVIIFGFGALAKFQSTQVNINEYTKKFQAEEMERQLEEAKIKVTQIRDLKATALEEELPELEFEEKMAQNKVDMFQYVIDRNIDLYANSYRTLAVHKLFGIKDSVEQLKLIPENLLNDDQKKQLVNNTSDISTLERIIENKDFKGFIAYLDKEIENDTSLSDEEKKIHLESNQIRLKYSITGEVNGEAVNGSASGYIEQLEKAKMSLLKNIDYTDNSQGLQPLAPEARQKIKDLITVIEYNFSKGIVSNESNSGSGLDMSSVAIPGMLSIGNFMIVILIMILAGGSVSSEMSTGSIKSLIISPAKRWKIFTAKYLSLLTTGIIAVFVAYIVSFFANGIFFGFEAGTPYVYPSDGIAHEINFYLYQLARLFTDFIVVIIYMTFAFMLSIITRNTAVSVAATIAVYFIGNTANAIVMQFFKGEWLKFIPFNNMDFTKKIFSFDTTSPFSGGMSGPLNSLNFSLIYIAVLLICMMYIGLDSFNRRDIK